jgi:hypothetical protein
VALTVAGVKIVNAITGPVCLACENGDHEHAELWHTQQRCVCACNQEGIK